MGVVTSSQIKGLEESFQTFTELSQSLETTYHSLEERVTELHCQLKRDQQGNERTQRETQSRMRLLANVIKVLPAGVLVLDSSGRVQECNVAAEQLLGERLRGELWIDVVSRCFSPQLDDGHEISLRDGRRVSVSTCPLGEEPGQVLLLTDVTETRCLQERLSQQKRLAALGEMAASLAHQIRTPLAAAILAAPQIKNEKLAAPKRGALVEKLLSSMRQLESLVNDMLLFSRSGYTGEEPFSITSLLESLQAALHGHTHYSARNCSVINDAKDTSIIGNQSVLHSALLNLVNNALEASGESGKVTVHVYSSGLNTVDIKVEDNGCGVPPEIREQIFEPFFTTRTNGTGLGLAVVRAIARAHRGEIWLESKQGEGSVFIMRLPIIGNNI